MLISALYPVKSRTTDRFAVEPREVGWLPKRLGPLLPTPALRILSAIA